MSNNIRTRNGIPFDFPDGLRIKGIEIIPATPTTDGLMGAADKAKLDNLATTGVVNTATNLRPGANQGIVWDIDAFGGGGDSASITLETAGGEATKMRFKMTNDADDNFEFTAKTPDGLTVYNNAMTLNGNVILNAANYVDYAVSTTVLNSSAGAASVGVTPVGNIGATDVQAALAELDSEKMPVNNAAFTGTPTAPTPPQFDNDTSVATTEFVQRALGNYREHSQISADTTLTIADAGKVFRILGTGFSVALPSASLVTAGQAFHFYTPFDSDGCTITTPLGSVIHVGRTANNSQTMAKHQFWTLISNGTALYTVQMCFFYNGIGDYQTWQDVTGSRILGTTYTNSTGRSIMVQVRSYTNGNVCAPTVDGLLLAGASQSSTDGYPSVTFIVPPGSTYSFESTSLSRWVELR